MHKKALFKIIIISLLCSLKVSPCLAETVDSIFSPIKTVSPNATITKNEVINIDLQQDKKNIKFISLDEKDTFNNISNATDRFIQCNIKASWEDFKTIINTQPPNDFIYTTMANKMADLGLFDLASLASSKIKDKELSNLSIDAMKRFYYPRRKLKLEDELTLAEAYSNILYNNQSSEAANEIIRNQTLLNNYDYANYIVALGFYKSEMYSKAAQYINIALLQNPSNLNYQLLKAEILADSDKGEEAIKIVNDLKKQNLYSYEYERKVQSLEQFILYKTQKAQWAKDYHLGYYYYIENDPSRAIRALQTALSARKKGNTGLIYSLMSKIYLSMDEFEKATDTAKKAYKINSNNPKSLLTLGDLSYQDKNFKQALNYYKKASNQDKKDYNPFIKEALTYQKLGNTKKAQEIYTKILKSHSDSWEAYYNVALLNKDDSEKQTIYFKKALAINPLFQDAWIDLAKINIDKGNYELAQQYLSNAFYIDENNFKYYYYQGLLNVNSSNFNQAKFNFKKCLKLNPGFNDAQKALENVLHEEENNLPSRETI